LFFFTRVPPCRLNELFDHTCTEKDVPSAFRDCQVLCQLVNLVVTELDQVGWLAFVDRCVCGHARSSVPL
jgi:hypothetical protein